MTSTLPTVATQPQAVIAPPGPHGRQLRHAAQRLCAENGIPEDRAAEVEVMLMAEYARLAAGARVTDFLTVFAERAVRERLRAAWTVPSHDAAAGGAERGVDGRR